jgi:tripartite-type tricarboxylate transporter receptor subunit TctC
MPLAIVFAAVCRVAGLSAALATAFPVAHAYAQTYPLKPIRLVVPYPAGTGTDIVARAIGQKLSTRPGYSVVIDNRPGGGTIIGMDIAAKATPDGYTLLLATTSLAITPGLHDRLPFDPIRDFAPIMLLDSAPLLLVANGSLNIANVRDLIALAKTKPGELNYASSGNGGAIHLAMELLKTMTDIRMNHIPFKGSPAALLDVLAGRVPVMFNIISSSTPHVTSGKLRALAVSGLTRSAALPAVPTIAESGVPGYEAVSWHGMLAPAGTPSAVLNALENETAKALREPDVKQTLESQGFDIRAENAAKFGAFVRAEVAKWTKVVKSSGARID